MDHEKPGMPTPATLILDSAGTVQLSTLNQWTRSVFARAFANMAAGLFSR